MRQHDAVRTSATTPDQVGANQTMPAPGRLTASRLELAKACAGAFALPHVGHTSEAAEKGTQIHAYIERLLTTGEVDASPLTNPEAREVCRRLDPTALYHAATGRTLAGGAAECDSGAPHLLVEQALAVSPDATEALALPPGAGHRDYSEAPEGWVCGTADVVALSEEDGEERAVITDWKTGSPLVAPDRHEQLRFLALAAALSYEVESVAVQIGYIGSDGDITCSSFELREEDLRQIARDLRELSARVQSSREGALELAVGAHCRYCPAFSFCPAQSGAAQALLEETLDELTPARVAEVWERLQAVEAALKKSKEALFGFVDAAEGVELPAGGKLRIVESRRDRLLPEVTMPLLRDLYGDEADLAVTITKKGLQKVAGGKTKEVLKTIEGRRGVDTTYSERLQEVGKKKG